MAGTTVLEYLNIVVDDVVQYPVCYGASCAYKTNVMATPLKWLENGIPLKWSKHATPLNPLLSKLFHKTAEKQLVWFLRDTWGLHPSINTKRYILHETPLSLLPKHTLFWWGFKSCSMQLQNLRDSWLTPSTTITLIEQHTFACTRWNPSFPSTQATKNLSLIKGCSLYL